MNSSGSYLYRLWDLGQQHLAAGRYGAARHALERASDLALAAGDLATLARVYLPLLEVRRLMRYRAVEGGILLLDASDSAAARRQIRQFQQHTAGTLLIADAQRDPAAGRKLACALQRAGRRLDQAGGAYETLLVFQHASECRMASPHAATFAEGLALRWTLDPKTAIGASTDADLCLPLPPAGKYEGRSGLGALARESLLVAWEALALRWQVRHKLSPQAGPWEEIRWLRAALRIDPACEPVTMRLIAVAEGLQRTGM